MAKKRGRPKKKPTFEESIDIIDNEIRKRRAKWKLQSLNWMDYDDVSQIIRIHIFKKWQQYDSSQPLEPWLNRIISNQIKNLIRNNYSNYTRPCLKCAAYEGNNLCLIYGKESVECPLYAKWKKTKESAHNLKITLPLESHAHEILRRENENPLDFEFVLKKFHKEITKKLKPLERKVYILLYIENKSEEETAKLMGYKTSEKDRKPGYKQIKNIQKSILEKAKKLLSSNSFDISDYGTE